jgi:hypothetical protein
MKSGPLGKALVSAISELPLISKNDKIMANLLAMGGEGLAKYIAEINAFSSKILARKGSCLGKLSVFGDKEGKTRIVAIVDYWTQTVLKPYHDCLMAILKRLSPDCTFNQDNYKRLLTFPGPYQSIDLSNATDRMPLWLQKAIIAFI